MNGKQLTGRLAMKNVSHSFGNLSVLKDLQLCVAPGELVVMVGPSGCGKTTLLNLLSGNIDPVSGVIERDGITRMVYQQDGLFPWLTVSENISMGTRQIADAGQRNRELEELIELVRLAEFKHHYPHELSGGMRQRVELARVLAGHSDILLMDEPFSSLDYQSRYRMRMELIRLLEKRPRTVVFVTHDIEEAVQLADRVVVLSGRPAFICKELKINSPRPRNPSDPCVIEAMKTILDELGLRSDQKDK